MNSFSPHPASTAIYVGLTAIGMTFAALTSAMVVRKGGALDWRHFALPSILYLNTVVILLSSVSLEIGRRSIATFMVSRGRQSSYPVRWLHVTSSLGVLFVVGQCLGWLQLRREGLYLPTAPSSSFFYVLTVAHALHILGGLGGLLLVIHRLKRMSLRKSTLDAVSRYWHFVDALWVYLLWLLWMNV
jgi:cytochrome c oxidase subunit 3